MQSMIMMIKWNSTSRIFNQWNLKIRRWIWSVICENKNYYLGNNPLFLWARRACGHVKKSNSPSANRRPNISERRPSLFYLTGRIVGWRDMSMSIYWEMLKPTVRNLGSRSMLKKYIQLIFTSAQWVTFRLT